MAGVLVTATAGLVVPGPASGGFTATTGSANSFAAAPTFPDYPTSILADGPSVYYRFDDQPGSVTAIDSSGNGVSAVYGTADNATWSGLWPMDEGAGATAVDLSGVSPARSLTLAGATWTSAGRRGSALAFNGTSATAGTASSVVATASSFTVSAWVYLTSTTAARTAVSQDGGSVSAFELGYQSTTNRWVFRMPRSDSTFATVDVASSASVPTLNAWTQLTATFTPGANGMVLYVNGAQSGVATFAGTPWSAGGSLVVGAGKSTNRIRYWQGRVDAVRVQPGAVSPATARELTLGPSGGAITSWPLDEGSGTTTVDYSGNLSPGTLGAGAAWGAPKTGASSVDLHGTSTGYVSGSVAGVDTRSSFTVTAWVYLDHTTLDAMSRVAVSQSGSVKSGFILRYNHYGHQWEFGLNRGAADDYTAASDSAYSTSYVPALATWTHLVGVYDATTGIATLYVDGIAQGSVGHTDTFRATGPVQVGRVREFGSWQTGTSGLEGWGPWSGRVDEVNVYARALDAAEVTSVYAGGRSGTTLGVPGALDQPVSTSLAFARNARSSYVPVPFDNPTTYTVECWFRSTGVPAGTRGQTLLAFSSAATGNSLTQDRRIYLDTTGHLVAGTASGSGGATSSDTYLDGFWHHVAATVSPTDGIHLYADGAPVATAAYTAPSVMTGYWRLGGDTWNGTTWPADYYWLGQLDEVAIYPTALSAERIAVHLGAGS